MQENGETLHVVVVGGGITGLSAAWYLGSLAERPVDVTVLEKSYRWGGVLQTDKINGPNGETFTVDGGRSRLSAASPKPGRSPRSWVCRIG